MSFYRRARPDQEAEISAKTGFRKGIATVGTRDEAHLENSIGAKRQKSSTVHGKNSAREAQHARFIPITRLLDQKVQQNSDENETWFMNC